MFVTSLGQHLRQIADLGIRAQVLAAQHQPDRMLRKFGFKSLHKLNGRVISLTDALVDYSKNNFVLRIILQAMTAQTSIHFRVRAFERLEDGDGRQSRCDADASTTFLFAQKSCGAPQA